MALVKNGQNNATSNLSCQQKFIQNWNLTVTAVRASYVVFEMLGGGEIELFY